MRRFTIAVALTAVSAVSLAVPSGALANAAPSNQTEGDGTISGLTGWFGSPQGGQNLMTTQYRASYDDSFWGPVTCSGVNQTGDTISSKWGRDSYTCTSTIGNLTATPYVGGTGGVYSDFWALQGKLVLFEYTITATDGLTYFTAVANYLDS